MKKKPLSTVDALAKMKMWRVYWKAGRIYSPQEINRLREQLINAGAITTNTENKMKEENESKLVDAAQLLEIMFEKKSRPSLAWLRMQTTAGKVPHVNIGRLIFYDLEAVRAAWFPKK